LAGGAGLMYVGLTGSPHPSVMDFHILGPLEARDQGRVVTLGGAKQRALLAVLLLHRGETLSADRLIDELWGERPPATAAKTVQVYVSRLRKALAGEEGDGSSGPIVTREHGYELELDPERLDAHRFEGLIAEGRRELVAGRPKRAASALQEALSLWRGPPLANLAYEPFAQREIARLEDLHVGALEQLIEARMALGAHGEVVGQLETLIAEHPYRERLRAQLMLALYRSDRQADALQAYQDARRQLVDELGIEPGEPLRGLERAILAHDPALAVSLGQEDGDVAAPSSGPGELPTGVVTFLLTDIEGSSGLWEADSAAMAAALELHDDLIASTVQAHDGQLLKAKGEGDATVTVFPRASDGVAAAVDLQQALGRAIWPGELELRVRIAVHTGEAHERAGDYFGPALNRAARLRGLARGGATVMSQATAEIVHDRLPPDAELVDLGRRELRGLTRPENVFGLRPVATPGAAPTEVLAAERAATELAVGPTRVAFVGRERELAELDAGLEDAFARRGRLFLLAGEPGIGKSWLSDELMTRARARGATVLVGRCWEAGGAPAYWPWIQSLRAYLGEVEPETLRTQLGAGAGEVAQLLPELRSLFPEFLEPPALESEGARFRLFDAVASFLRSAAQTRPLVLVLDDLHAADQPSLLLLQFVAREIGQSRLLVLCAFRNVDPTLRDPLISALAELVREPHTTQIELAGLGEPEVAAYVELSTGMEPSPRLVQTVHDETEGNSLFIAEVVRLLEAEGRLADPDAHLRIPPSVRSVIGQRVGRLSEDCRRLLVPAAVMGREFGLEALARLSELDRDELLGVLDEAMAERVVGEVPRAPGRLRFGHALIRDTLYDDLTPARRIQFHQEVGEALEAVYAADLDSHLAELAHHFFAAAPAGVAGKAIDYGRRGGDRAASQLAYEEAVRLYEMALTLVDDDLVRCELLLASGEAHARAGDTPASKHVFREAAELADRRGLAEHLARAAIGYGGRVMWEVSRDDDYLVPLLERALAAIGGDDSPLRVRLLARLAGGPLRDASFPPERKRLLSREALDMARRIDDPETLAHGIHGYILGHHSPDHAQKQLELATELIDAATQAGDPERVVEGYEERLDSLLELGELDAAKRDLEALSRVANELRQPSQAWIASVYRAMIALLEGRFDEAEILIPEARDLGERALSWSAAVSYGLQLYVLRRQQGRLGEVEQLVRSSVEQYSTYPIWRCAMVQTTAELGQIAEARSAFENLATDGFASLPFDEEWLVSMGMLAETARTLGDAERAAILYEPLLPYGNHVAICYPDVMTGAVSLYLGILAETMERRDDAVGHFEDAIDMNGRIGARPWLAHARHDLAATLLARGRPEDTARAQQLLSQALTGYRELDMQTYAARASALTLG
jgi:DNA-binding SARP family transcriptional activator